MRLTQSFNSLGFLIVPIIGGIIGEIDARLFYPVASVLVFIAFLLLIIRKQKHA